MGKAKKTIKTAKAPAKPRTSTPLHDAAGRALADVQKLVAQGQNVNAVDAEGRTPLHVAARSNKLDIVQFLLKKGAQVNARMPHGFTPLHYAARHARLEVVEWLVDNGADVNAAMENGMSVAHIAIEKDRVDVVGFLLKKGADIKALMWRSVSVLQTAAREGKLDVVKFFIEQGSDVNTTAPDGASLLHDAAGREQLAVVEYLLERDADVHVTDKEGRTPLHYALFGANKKCGRVYPIVHQLATRGACWDASCERELNDLLKRNHRALEAIEGEGDSLETKTIRWQAGVRACVCHWDEVRVAHGGAAYPMDIPVEVIERGDESVATYVADLAKSGADQLILRRKICVVGPSQWGKTSLVKSMTSLEPTLVHVDDRTIGIDLFAHSFTQDDGETRKQHEVTFWDFAGQDEYQVAHAMFFSKRTLYLLCIDLERYQHALDDADKLSSPREAEHFMARFMRTNVFRWVRAILSRQADAEFVVVGTKMDKMKSERQIGLLWRDLSARLHEWTQLYANEIDHEYAAAAAGNSRTAAAGTDEYSHYHTLKQTLSHLFAKDWLTVSSTDVVSIQRARDALEAKITQSDRSFLMPIKYTRVLEAVRSRRDKAVRMGSAGRIAHMIAPVRALSRELMRDIDDLGGDECRTILQTLHDVGDLLWYQHEASGVMKDTIILDPTLVLDVVREVITHEHSKRMAHLPASYVDEGRLTHAFLQQLPLWQKLDEELMFAFKQLLQYFQLAYPADNHDMDWDSDLIVPTYWKVNKASVPQRRLNKQRTMMARHGVASAAASHYCWEYELSAEVAETVFEQFAVQSYSSLLQRSVHPKCIEAYVHGDCAVLITLTARESVRDVIRIEVAVADATIGWQYLRYYVMAIETVLDSFPGLVISRYIVDTANAKPRRHRLGEAVKTLQDASWMGKDESTVRADMPWLPPDMDWFIEKAWLNPGALHELRTQELVREAVSKVDVLKKLVVADEVRRRYPALWTLQFDATQHKLTLKMLSDLSGECFHEPITMEVPSSFYAKHGSVLQHGMALLSNVVPEIVSLGIMQKVINAVAPVLTSQVERAEMLYNLIDNLDLSTSHVREPAASGKLSPRGAVALLRDLLKLHDSAFDELTISELAQLQCAATAEGHYVWAHRREIMELGDKLTPCDLQDVKQMKRSLSQASTDSSSTSSRKSRDSAALRLRLSIATIDGFTAWDWRKVYCKWQLVHPNASAPLASGSTPVHGDYEAPPSWEALEFAITRVESIEMLRQCRLHVRIKRPSRCLGIVKCIAEGTAAVADFVARTTEEIDDDVVIHVPLDSTEVATRTAIVHLAP